MRKMKDSGLQWIGQIPEEWAAGRMKDVIGLLTDYTANGSFGDLAKNVQYLDDGFARLVRLTDLRENLTNANGIFIDEPTFNYLAKSKLKGGDILVANVGAYSGLFCEMPKVEYPCSLAPNMFLIRTNKRMIQHFLFYVGSSNFVWEQLVQKAVSSAQPKLNKTDIKTTFLPIPPLAEQQRIADFLDEKCGEIDSIRSDIQKQIDILNDYKKSVITEAVTKGLNPKAKLKDSGIEWIGKIPEGWVTRRLKELGKVRNGLTYSPTDICDPDEGYLVLRSSNIKDGKLSFEDNVFVSCRIPHELIVQKGDILICSRNGSRKLIGKNAIIDDVGNGRVTYGAFMMVFRTKYTKYLYYILNSGIFSYYLGSFFTSTINQLTGFDFGNMVVPFCTDGDEQKAIADYLDEKCSEIDATIADKQKQLETLDEYKKSLIFEYVTGKKEVLA